MINLLKNGRGLFFLLLGVSSTPMISSASCQFGNEEKIELFLTPQTKSWGDFSGRQEITPSTVTKCGEDAGKYLMISLGVSQASDNAAVRDTFIFNTYKPGACRLNNSASMQKISSNRLAEQFSQQYKMLRSCYDLKVNDIGKAALKFKSKQEHCKIQPTPDGGALLKGDMCFIKISGNNQFAFLPILKSECQDPDYLRSLGLMPQDLEANLNILVVGDDSGNSEDLAHIGLRPIHMSVTPNSKSIPLSDDNGPEMPRFVTNYSADVDWGPLHIRSGGEKTQIDLTLLASNFSDKSCVGNECTRASNYTQPVFGQVQVFGLKNHRPELLQEWWDGGFASPNWQGFLSGLGFSVNEEVFKVGERYRIQMTFQDPTDDYAIYLSGLSQMLINLGGLQDTNVGIDAVPAVDVLQQLGIFPSLSGTSDLRSANQTVSLTQATQGLASIIANRVWPAYYGKVCDSSKTKCLKLGKQKFYQRLTMEFTAGRNSDDTGEMILENVMTQKESTVFKSYPMSQRSFPSITCGAAE